jgi:hypothetical protein
VAAQQQIEILAMRRNDGLSYGRVGMRHCPSAVGVVAVFARPAGGLDHAVQRDMFDDPDLSHGVSTPNWQREWLDTTTLGLIPAPPMETLARRPSN